MMLLHTFMQHVKHDSRPLRRSPLRNVDGWLTALLAIQVTTMFVLVPLGRTSAPIRELLTVAHVATAIICAYALTRRRSIRIGLAVVAFPWVMEPIARSVLPLLFASRMGLGLTIVAIGAVMTNLLTVGIIASVVFGPGRVTTQRVQGAVLLYLNSGAVFTIVYAVLVAWIPRSIAFSHTDRIPDFESLQYFSLVTLTSTGFGDIVPIHPIARSVCNLEAVLGHLFPATFLARIVALYVAHDLSSSRSTGRAENGTFLRGNSTLRTAPTSRAPSTRYEFG